MSVTRYISGFFATILMLICANSLFAENNKQPSPGFVLAIGSSQPLFESESKTEGYFKIDLKYGLSRDSALNDRASNQTKRWQRDIEVKVVPVSQGDFKIILSTPTNGDGILISESAEKIAPEEGYQPSLEFVKVHNVAEIWKTIYFKRLSPVTYSRVDFKVMSGKYTQPLFLNTSVYTNIEGSKNTEYDYVYTLKRKINKLDQDYGKKTPENIFVDPADLRKYEAYSQQASRASDKVPSDSPEVKMKDFYESRIQYFVERQKQTEENIKRRNKTSFKIIKPIVKYYLVFSFFACCFIYVVIRFLNKAFNYNIPSMAFICTYLSIFNIYYVKMLFLGYFKYNVGGAGNELASFFYGAFAIATCLVAVAEIKNNGCSKLFVILPVLSIAASLILIVKWVYVFLALTLGWVAPTIILYVVTTFAIALILCLIAWFFVKVFWLPVTPNRGPRE